MEASGAGGTSSVDAEAIRRNPFTLVPHSREKFEYLAAFDIQLDLGFTMRSRFVPLSVSQARALSAEHERRLRDADDDSTDGMRVAEEEDESDPRTVVALLADRVQHLITHHFAGKPVFVRLSTQSPKDVGRGWTEHAEVGSMLRDEVAVTESCGRTLNDRVRALFATSLRLMKVRTGREALDLLLKSERIHSSIQHALANVDLCPWDLSIVVREWRDDMRLENEFRTFVVRNRIVAISQYNEYCHYPAWEGKEHLIAEKILRLFVEQGLREKLPLDYRDWAYVIDFLVPNDEDSEAMMVEVNPFGYGTGASLFDWKRERRLLQGDHDLWGDLSSAGIGSGDEEGVIEWCNTVRHASKEGDVCVRLASRPRPDLDSSFLSSFGIDILLPTTDDSNDDEDQDTDEEEEDEDEEDDENFLEFVDTFATESHLRPIVRNQCAGQFAKRWTKTFVAGAVEATKSNQQAHAWLHERGLAWCELVEQAVARGAQQWYAYCIATRG